MSADRIASALTRIETAMARIDAARAGLGDGETRGGGMALVDQINKAHGEGPDQGRIAEEGNAYLDAEFPGLSYIVSMRLADSLGAE